MGRGTLWVHAFKKALGKRIQGLMVVQSPDSLSCRAFLVFDDGTHYELYGDIDGCKDIDKGGLAEIRETLRGWPGATVILEAAAEAK
jgi:hypothetical protein